MYANHNINLLKSNNLNLITLQFIYDAYQIHFSAGYALDI